MEDKKLYLVYTCDAFKSLASFHLCGITRNKGKLIEAVLHLVQNDVISIDDENHHNEEELMAISTRQMNDIFNYLYIQEIDEDNILTDGSYH